MNQEILLQILFANGHDNLVAHAVKLANNIEDGPQPTMIVVNCDKKHIPAGMKAKGDKGYWVDLPMPVIAFNKYKIKEQYLIQHPDGTTAWKSISGNTATELIPVDQEKAVADLS